MWHLTRMLPLADKSGHLGTRNHLLGERHDDRHSFRRNRVNWKCGPRAP